MTALNFLCLVAKEYLPPNLERTAQYRRPCHRPPGGPGVRPDRGPRKEEQNELQVIDGWQRIDASRDWRPVTAVWLLTDSVIQLSRAGGASQTVSLSNGTGPDAVIKLLSAFDSPHTTAESRLTSGDTMFQPRGVLDKAAASSNA